MIASKPSPSRPLRSSSLAVVPTLALLLIVTCIVSIGIGAIRITPLEVLQAMTNSSGSVNARISMIYLLISSFALLGVVGGDDQTRSW